MILLKIILHNLAVITTEVKKTGLFATVNRI